MKQDGTAKKIMLPRQTLTHREERVLLRAVSAGRVFPAAIWVQGDPNACEQRGVEEQQKKTPRIVRGGF
jgi:hypothetical protein